MMIAVDLQFMGQRHKDLKNRLSAPQKLTSKSVTNMLTKLSWGIEMLGTKRRFFENIFVYASGVTVSSSLNARTAEAFDETLDWNRIKEFREIWDGPFITKGIIDPRDAKEALNVGVDAIVVSNHGGRQLDGALSTIRALPHIMYAVGDKNEVHSDGGIRSG